MGRKNKITGYKKELLLSIKMFILLFPLRPFLINNRTSRKKLNNQHHLLYLFVLQ